MIQRNKISGIPTASFPLRPAARLRTALAGTALGLAGLAFAAPLAVSAVMSLPELGIDAGPRLSIGNAASAGFSGTCSENLQAVALGVRHGVSGQRIEAPVVSCADGVWQVSGLDLSGLSDGPLLIEVEHNDLSGQRVALSASLVKGGVTPRVGINAPALIHTGNLEAYVLSGTCSEEGQKVALTLGDAQGHRVTSASSLCTGQHWSAALSSLATLNDGVITATVSHSEISFGTANLSGQVLKNTALPGLSIDPFLWVKSSNQAAFSLSGACSEAQQPVSLAVSDSNKATIYGSAPCSGKSWKLPTLDLSSLSGGELRFVATHANAAPVVRTVLQAGLKETSANSGNGSIAATTSSRTTPSVPASSGAATVASLLPAQSITFNSLGKKALGDMPFSVAATASSGLPVSFSSLTPQLCTSGGSQGSTISLLLLGTCTLEANQAGNSQTAAALPVAQSFTVGVPTRDASYGQPAIAAGGNHTIAIKAGGTVWTWGDNERGQLGDGTNLMRSTPVLVSGLSAIAVGAGASHSVALQSSGGTIVTWGNNDFGQLGNGAAIAVRTDSKVPVALSGTNLPVFSAIAVGANHTLALSGGKVWAWGANGDGQLGNNTRTDSATPVQVLDSAGNALTGVRAITAGANHSLALVGNVVWAWGRNSQGQLGIATATPYKATAITTLTGVTAIAAGGEHSLALIDDGTVRTWGSNWAGQLGNLSKTDSATPITVLASASTSLTKVVKIAAGNAYSLALLSNGQVLAWGYGAAGQVGSASSRDNPTPVVVIAANPDITALAAGDNHAFALKTTDGTVLAWGDNGRGQLGDGTLTFRQEAVVIPNLPAPTNIFAGAYHLMSKGAAGASSNDKSWGSNWKGQLAEAAPSLYKPAPTLSLLSATPIAAGAAHTLSGVQSVGDNQAAELGRIPPGTPIPTWTASIGAVGGLPTSVTSVAAGTRHSLAAFGKDIWVWGANEAGQLGNGSTPIVDSTQATKLSDPFSIGTTGTATIAALAAGAAHSVALANGKVYVWGSNLVGQLGESTITTPSRNSPYELTSCSSATQIAVGWYHTAALCSGSVWTWGNNSMGQLGHALGVDNAPGQVTAVISGVTKIAVGAYHTLAMNVTNGKVWAWGSNQYGQLGDSSTINRSTPIEIVSSGATDIAAGAGYSVIVKSTGETVVMGDGRDGQLGRGDIDKASAIRPTPAAAMISLAGGSVVSLLSLAPSVSLTSSLAGTAYWLVQPRTLAAPTFTEIKSRATGSGAVSAGIILPVLAPNLTPGVAYRLFACVSVSTDGLCTGNAASIDFIAGTTTLQLPTSTPTAIGTKATTITVTRSGDSSQAASVSITDIIGGSANYMLSSTTLSFAVGVSSATFTITPTKVGYGKTAQLLLSLTGGSGFGSTGSITVNLKKPANLAPILMLLLD